MPFDARLYAPLEGSGADLGEELIGQIGSTPPAGGTRSTMRSSAPMSRLQGMRSYHGDTLHYGIVVLSDWPGY